MCGIYSEITRHGEVEPESIARALSALRHRGPDGNATWLAPDRRVALAHARLSIIDLTTGAQPIASEDDLVHLVVNGELYDFERIRAALEARGHVFRTRSDSEIALHLYQDHGLDFVHHLRGEFALVLHDAKRGRLVAARDPFGIKPLCWTAHGGRIRIASEAKALFAAGVPAAWDHDAVFHVASTQYQGEGDTLFAGVKQVPPGHLLVVDAGGPRLERYWDLSYPVANREARASDVPGLVEAFGAKLEESIRLRLRADVPVCCHLSGGLDSTAVVGLAARHATGPVTCFTVSFEVDAYDELSVAAEMAARVNARLEVVRITQADLMEHLSDAVYFSEGLAVNGHLTGKFLLSRAIRNAGFKVALTGEGADELLGGYPHLREDLLNEQGAAPEKIAALHASNAASAGIMLSCGPVPALASVRRALGYVPAFLAAKASFGERVHGLLASEFRARFAGRDAYAEWLGGLDLPGQLAGRTRVDQSLYLWSKRPLANYILRTLGDGAEMAHSIEGRLPFLDRPLFELARALPLDLKIRDGVEKFVLREAARPHITDTVYRRPKHPFLAPPLTRFSGSATSDLVQDTLRGEALTALPFFDAGAVRATLDRLGELSPAERAGLDPVLMLATTACLLHQRLGLSGGGA